MNDGSNVTYSSSAYDSTVGIQAETVHNSTVNFVSPDASPQEKYKVGVRFLEEGVPSRARDLISEAIAHGYDNAKVRFHWVLAMLSARDHHDLDAEERQRLRHASEHVEEYSEGEWKDALRVTFSLIPILGTAKGETKRVLERLQDLSSRQRDAILHHLDLVLAGELKEGLWSEYRKRAEAARFGNDRIHRAWAYFVPDPIGPRALPPRPSTAATARAALPVRAGLFVVATAVLGVLALIANPAAAAIQVLVALGAGLAAARSGRLWWYQKRQLRNRVHESLVPHLRAPAATGDGFTNRVRHSFDYYFSIRAPHGFTSEEWLGYTIHVRNRLVGEIAFLYRESRISVDRVNWLIRYLAEDTRERYNKGSLFGHRYQNQNETLAAAKVICVIALVALGIIAQMMLGTVASGGDSSQTLLGILAVVGAVWSGHAAASCWLEAESEERRILEETQEYQERLAARESAYESWKSYLEATRPTELEMETWLTCDKTLLVDEALRHYQLTWRDLIAHTILMTPARPYKRGRIKGGPWRYSRYGFRLFLVTQEGVREISTEFDFADAKRGDKQRSNYRFDALSSVQVSERANVGYDLELILTNGPSRSIRVKDADSHQLASGEDAEEISEINLNAAGFTQTFRLLEGIAADGKGWLERNNPNGSPSFGTAD
ncbi:MULTISPECIES: hypothetical protein [unclassified Streptomyces]|uniref:hypothetical protein n=1 Tax=unclassified Streptomyces TaxID=2593676 RepID=UPI001908177E|nr:MULTISPECIES: hypothetical protein [unclassified Streptomyces]MCU4748092.1 hypothetical protein [Streptomyces sp. G-5]QQN78692.1 hypothetical protein IPZ77_15510 [Streptomyces sp. XC 2026]